jgi:hypothetical protein
MFLIVLYSDLYAFIHSFVIKGSQFYCCVLDTNQRLEISIFMDILTYSMCFYLMAMSFVIKGSQFYCCVIKTNQRLEISIFMDILTSSMCFYLIGNVFFSA